MRFGQNTSSGSRKADVGPSADTSPTSSLPPHDGGGGPGQGVEPKKIKAPNKVARVLGTQTTPLKKVEAPVHELRPRTQDHTAPAFALKPAGRIVRVRDTQFSYRVARLTQEYKANKLCQV